MCWFCWSFRDTQYPHNIGTLDIHVLTNPAALVDMLICQTLRLSGMDVLNLDNHPTVLLWKACFEKINLKVGRTSNTVGLNLDRWMHTYVTLLHKPFPAPASPLQAFSKGHPRSNCGDRAICKLWRFIPFVLKSNSFEYSNFFARCHCFQIFRVREDEKQGKQERMVFSDSLFVV